jgi:type II secretory pathway component HofQ
MKRSTALRRIVLAAYLGLGVLSICAATSAQEQREPPAAISIDIRDAGLSDALVLLAKETGISIAMPFAVDGRVTAHLRDVTLPAALTALLSPFDLTWRIDSNGVYVVTHKGELVQPAPPVGPPEEDVAGESNLSVEKIPLKYADPYQIYAFLSGDETRRSLGIGSLSIIPNPWDNSLLGRFGNSKIVTFPSDDFGAWNGPGEAAGGPIGPGSGPGTGGGGGGTQ